MVSSYYEDAYYAFVEYGAQREDNPYMIGTYQFEEWDNGWCDAWMNEDYHNRQSELDDYLLNPSET